MGQNARQFTKLLLSLLSHIGEMENVLPSVALSPNQKGPPSLKAMEGILRSAPGVSWLRAKDGGSPRCCPVLCGLRDRCIAAMLATLKGRDTKAELNRRNQACDVLTDTGIRVAKNRRASG